jgi:hypothetical protein
MSLNKFTNAEESILLGLEGGFKKLIVDELIENGALSSSVYRSSGTTTLQNNIVPESVFPVGFGSLTLPSFKLGDAYEMNFHGLHQASLNSQVEFVLSAGTGSSVPIGSLQQTWAVGAPLANFKLNVKFVTFLDGGVTESVRSYFELTTEDGALVFKGTDNPQFTLPFDQVQDVNLTMQVTNVTGVTEFVFQCAEFSRTR